MATVIRPEISEKNKYYIDKHRYYELKHFCLQYREWKKAYQACEDSIIFTSKLEHTSSSNTPSDLTAKYAVKKLYYAERISLIEKAAAEVDDFLGPYILKAVTEDLSYVHMKTKMSIPCGRDMYYNGYRRFFWLLSEMRN